jgi:hypothetical protein
MNKIENAKIIKNYLKELSLTLVQNKIKIPEDLVQAVLELDGIITGDHILLQDKKNYNFNILMVYTNIDLNIKNLCKTLLQLQQKLTDYEILFHIMKKYTNIVLITNNYREEFGLEQAKDFRNEISHLKVQIINLKKNMKETK